LLGNTHGSCFFFLTARVTNDQTLLSKSLLFEIW